MAVSRVLFSFSRRKFSPLARRVSFLRQNQTGLRNLCPSMCAMANKNQSFPDSFIAFYLLRRYNPPISLLILNIPLLFFSFIQRPFSVLYRWALNEADKRDEIYPISSLYRLFIILCSFLFVLFYFFYFFFLFQEFERSINNKKKCNIFKEFTFHLFNIHTKFKREKLKIFSPSFPSSRKKKV